MKIGDFAPKVRISSMREEFLPFLPPPADAPFRILLAGRSYCDGSYLIRRAPSPLLCVEFVEKGQGTVICNGKRHTARAGDVYILRQGQDHVYFSSGEDPWQKIWFNANGRMIEGVLSAYLPHDTVVFQNMWEMKPLFDRLHGVVNEVKDAAGQHEAAASAFFALVQALYARSKAQDDRETRALENLIESDISRKWTVGELAAHAFRSPSQINRMFRRDTGMAPYEYILSRRLARAKLLLSSTSMQIREIADCLGFCDEHYFTSLFKEKVGIAPGEYRRGDREKGKRK